MKGMGTHAAQDRYGIVGFGLADDSGGVECSAAWTGGNDKDIPVRHFIFSPSRIPPRSNQPAPLDARERCVHRGYQLFPVSHTASQAGRGPMVMHGALKGLLC